MKRQAIFLVALLTSTALVGCGGKKTPSSSEIPVSSSSSVAPSSSSNETPSSSSLAPSSSSSLAPSSSSEAPSSSSQAPSSSSSLGPTPINPVNPDVSEPFDYTQKNYPAELLTTRRRVSVFIGETMEVKGNPQFRYSGDNLNYTSNNPAIATVDANGKVLGVAKGETSIVVSDKDNPAFKAEIDVIVNEEFATPEDAAARNTAIKALAQGEGRKSLVDKNMIVRDIYRYEKNDTKKENGSLYYSEFLDQRMTLDKDNAYFRIIENEAERKAEKGEMEFSGDDFVIENNEFYDTYLFRASGSAKKYLRVAAQNYKSGGDRLAPVYAVLDNVFTSGKGIFNNTLKNGSLKWLNSLYNILNDIEEEDPDEPEDPEEEEEEEEVEGEAGETRYGFVDNESMIVSGSYSYNDKFDLDDENRYGQPYGVPYTVNQKMRCTVVRGRVVSYTVEGKQVYSYGGYNYEEFFSIDHVYSEVTSADLVIPNKADYTEVFDLFDLY